MKVFIGLFLIIGTTVATRVLSEDKLQKLFIKFVKHETSETELNIIQDVLAAYRPQTTEVLIKNGRNDGESIECLLCRSAFGALIDLVREGSSDETLIDSVTTLCSALGFVTPRACSGLIDTNIPILTYIIRNTPEAAARTFCGLILQRVSDRNFCPYNDPRFEWSVALPGRSAIRKSKDVRTTPLTIALVSEAHIDPFYEVNGVADCDEPTCCRKGQTPRTEIYDYDADMHIDNIVTNVNKEEMVNLDAVSGMRNKIKTKNIGKSSSPPAGFWGDYRNCDTPIWAYDDAIERIASTHKDVEVVYYMGDSIDHHVWETTYELINEVNAQVIDKMRSEFGDNVLIIPCIGNHESQPTNQFAPSTVVGDKINTTWLYEGLARKWDFYLTEEAKATLREMGAFSMLVKPGLRVISMNNNVAYKSNWWLVYDPLDSKRHLDWLVAELHKAELAGEKVHILGHIPPGVHDFTFTWTREYNRIMTRFSATIAGEFNGHTHSDEFKVFYSLENGLPIGVAWGAGSVTAYTNYNLNYKIATIDPSSFEPVDIVNYIYNLTEANLTPNIRPRWYQLYDIRSAFGLTNLSPASMNALVYSMVTNQRQFLGLYSRFFSKESDRRWPYCNIFCQLDNLCKSVVTVLWQREKCEELNWLYFFTRAGSALSIE